MNNPEFGRDTICEVISSESLSYKIFEDFITFVGVLQNFVGIPYMETLL